MPNPEETKSNPNTDSALTDSPAKTVETTEATGSTEAAPTTPVDAEAKSDATIHAEDQPADSKPADEAETPKPKTVEEIFSQPESTLVAENTTKPEAKTESVALTGAEPKSDQTPREAKPDSAKPDSTSAAQTKPYKPSEKTSVTFKAVVISLLIVSLLMSAASLAYAIWDFLREDAPITFNYDGKDGNSANFVEGSIAEVAAKVTPGVVSIVTEVRTTGFFGQTNTSTAAGTGMIVTGDGYILTNKHVIDGANSIRIVMDDGTTYDEVEVVGKDPLNDVAYLKIKNAKDLPTVTLGNSKTITTGQQVIAIGNALGQFQNTITSGIISGTGRVVTATSSDYSSSETLSDLIQTDAAINAGNSGGPLVNAAGEVIGINTATSSEADGIGFAIPISSVKGMLKNIIEHNSATRSYLGVYYVSITPDVAKSYNLPVSAGAYLYSPAQYSSIIADGPGDKAGLKEKDIITAINGIKVGKSGSVSSLIGEYAPGDTVQLTVLREGKERTMNVTLGSYKK